MPTDAPLDSLTLKRAGPVRRALVAILYWTGLDRFFVRRHPAHCPAFTSALVALAAKLAKADGVAVKVEQEAFEAFLEVTPDELADVSRLFDLAKEDAAGFETYAEKIARQLKGQPDLERSVLECLLYIACSDGVLHPAEDAFLHTVAGTFAIGETEWRQMRAGFVHEPDSPYTVLGLPPGVSAAEVRKRYLKLIAENHPDRLMAAQAPAAVVKAATVKLQHINAAYDAIEAEWSRKRKAP